MKLLVGIKRVLDYRVKPRLRADGMEVDLQGVKMGPNPFDEIALEQAIRMKETGEAADVVVVSLGPSPCEDVLRVALAMGADRAIHGLIEQDLEPRAVAHVLKHIIATEQPDMVLLGKQAIDDDSNQVGQYLAGLLEWPQATFASELSWHAQDNTLTVVREVDGGLHTMRCQLPAVVTADLRLNEPRFPSLPNIMKAKAKPLDVVHLQDLGLDIAPRIQVLGCESPQRERQVRMLPDVAALVDALQAEGVL